MYRKEVLVVAVDGTQAMVTSQRQSACSSCHSNKGCDVKAYGSGQQDLLIPVNNPIQAKPGEYVLLELSEKQLLKAAFLVYGLPVLLFMLVGVTVNSMVLASVLNEWADLAGGASGIAAFVLSFFLLRHYNKRIQHDAHSLPTIVQMARGRNWIGQNR